MLKQKLEEINDLISTDLDGFCQDMEDPTAETELFDLTGKKVDGWPQ